MEMLSELLALYEVSEWLSLMDTSRFPLQRPVMSNNNCEINKGIKINKNTHFYVT